MIRSRILTKGREECSILSRPCGQTALMSYPSADEANACKRHSNDEVAYMEEHRCKIVAAEMDESRCKSVLNGGLAEVEDQRYNGLRSRTALAIDDRRYYSVAIGMEDPRCKNLRMGW